MVNMKLPSARHLSLTHGKIRRSRTGCAAVNVRVDNPQNFSVIDQSYERNLMRKLVIFFFFLAIACDKEDDPEKFSSLNGYWVVRTPDEATTVTFRIAVDADNNTVIDRASVQHDGNDYNSEPIDAALIIASPTEIESLTLVSGRLIIRFLAMTANSDFTQLQIDNSIFTIDGAFREFSMIQATRN